MFGGHHSMRVAELGRLRISALGYQIACERLGVMPASVGREITLR